MRTGRGVGGHDAGAGIDTATVPRVTLRSGRRAGLLTAAACATRLFAHAAAVAVPLAAVLTASATAQHPLRRAGAAFPIALTGLALATIPVSCSLA